MYYGLGNFLNWRPSGFGPTTPSQNRTGDDSLNTPLLEDEISLKETQIKTYCFPAGQIISDVKEIGIENAIEIIRNSQQS